MGWAQRQFKQLKLVELVVVAAISSFPLFLLWPVLSDGTVGRPPGEPSPSTLPAEANRVAHPQGFSIVFRPNWEVKVREGPRVVGTPRAISFGGRSAAAIWL